MWSSGWVYDDFHWVQQPQGLWRLAWWVGGGLPWAFHGFVLSLHLLNGLLLWWLVRSRIGAIGSWLTATLFLLHPLNSEAVAYVSGGIEVLLTSFALATVILWWYGGRFGLLLGSLTLWLAIGLKFSAWPLVMVLPLVVGLLRHWPLRRVAMGGGIVGAMAITLLWHRLPQLGLGWPMVSDLARVTNALWRYLLLVVWPFGFSIEHDWTSDPWVGLLTGGLTAISGVVCWWWRLFWAWGVIVGLILPRALIPGAPSLTEHHTYLPFLAIWVSVGVIADRFLQKDRVWPISTT